MLTHFKYISPQKVVHADGFEVEVVDRYTIKYSEGPLVATVEADFAELTGVNMDSMKVISDGEKASMTDDGRRLSILERIGKALDFMGVIYEFYHDGAAE